MTKENIFTWYCCKHKQKCTENEEKCIYSDTCVEIVTYPKKCTIMNKILNGK